MAKLKATQTKEEKQFGHTHHLLDYTYLQDLVELINRHWDLFQDLFGSDKKAKGQLTEKFQIVVKVRNPLAHNRWLPTAELTQAQMHCEEIMQLLP